MTLVGRMKSWLPFQTKNPEAFLGEGLAKQVGNVTECALLGFLTELGTYELPIVTFLISNPVL